MAHQLARRSFCSDDSRPCSSGRRTAGSSTVCVVDTAAFLFGMSNDNEFMSDCYCNKSCNRELLIRTFP